MEASLAICKPSDLGEHTQEGTRRDCAERGGRGYRLSPMMQLTKASRDALGQGTRCLLMGLFTDGLILTPQWGLVSLGSGQAQAFFRWLRLPEDD